MTSRMTDLSISLAQVEVMRALRDVEDMWLRANKRLVDAGHPLLSPCDGVADHSTLSFH